MDDVARAEEALVEVLARAEPGFRQDLFDEELQRDPAQLRNRLYLRYAPTLFALKAVTVETTCATCFGDGLGHVPSGNCWPGTKLGGECSTCNGYGTVSRSALAVLMGETQ